MASGFQKNIFQNFKVKAENDIFDFVGSGTPTDGTSGTGVNNAGKGSSYFDTATGYMYLNTGTKASPVWSLNVNNAILTGDVTATSAGVTAIGANKVTAAMLGTSVLQQATGTISAADLVSTSAGKFGHANGQTLLAGQGTHNVVEFVSLTMKYLFGVAAYTGGGNITVNLSGGGAAQSGLVSAANSVGAASSKAIVFYPLSTAGVAMVENGGINLVAASAFTQPGTATGTIGWTLMYRVHPTGF